MVCKLARKSARTKLADAAKIASTDLPAQLAGWGGDSPEKQASFQLAVFWKKLSKNNFPKTFLLRFNWLISTGSFQLAH